MIQMYIIDRYDRRRVSSQSAIIFVTLEPMLSQQRLVRARVQSRLPDFRSTN